MRTAKAQQRRFDRRSDNNLILLPLLVIILIGSIFGLAALLVLAVFFLSEPAPPSKKSYDAFPLVAGIATVLVAPTLLGLIAYGLSPKRGWLTVGCVLLGYGVLVAGFVVWWRLFTM